MERQKASKGFSSSDALLRSWFEDARPFKRSNWSPSSSKLDIVHISSTFCKHQSSESSEHDVFELSVPKSRAFDA